MPLTTLDCFAIVAPGLESLVADELRALGITPAESMRGGVEWRGTPDDIARANLWLRTASRVIVRVAHFSARTFAELERGAKKVPWSRYVSRGRPVRFRVTCRKSRLYHTGAVVDRLRDILAPLVGDPGLVSAASGSDDEEAPDAQLFLVRIERDDVTVSADTSGALLHRRGYRRAVAKAPLRETLAAAMLLASGWDRHVPLIDPMCGAGTIAIEAAWLARNIAPGRERDFAFLHWPGADGAHWATLVARAREAELERVPGVIRASDRDAGACRAALANAERAGVAADIDISQLSISAVEPVGSRGWIVTNPPYGVRVGDTSVRNLYAQLGKVAHATFPGWSIGYLSADPALDRQTRLSLQRMFATSNGGIPVRFMTGKIRNRGEEEQTF
jgi:putative N6-adenine-specific DNA methylase